MARWQREEQASGPLVQGFTPGGFSVDGNVYRAAFLTPQSAALWEAPPLADLKAGDFEPVLSLDPPPEFILLGTGSAHTFPPRALIRALEERGVGIEIMDSRAAARTWSLLRNEERWIAAALMPLD